MESWNTFANETAISMADRYGMHLLDDGELALLAGPRVSVQAGAVGLRPRSLMCGKLLLYFTYDGDDGPRRFSLWFTVRIAGNSDPSMTNYATDHAEYEPVRIAGVDGWASKDSSDFGLRAYRKGESPSTLKDDPEALAMKGLFLAAKRLSTRKGWCRRLRGVQDEQLAWESERRNRTGAEGADARPPRPGKKCS